MRYNEARDKIKTGDVLAFTHIGWSSLSDIESQIVRMFTRSEYSHIGIAWCIGGRVFIIEAVVPYIRIYPVSKFDEFFWARMPAALSVAGEEMALRLVGEGYSKLEAIKAFFGANKPNSRWECAELVKEVWAVDGVEFNGKATPTDVVNSAMREHCAQIIHVQVTTS